MSSAPPPHDDDGEMLAAELAFGLLDDHARHAADARLAGDAAFAAAHRRWQGYAAAMAAGDASDELPRPSIWPAIVARLPANDVAPARSGVRGWQASTAVAAAAAIVLGIVIVERGPAPAPVIAQAQPVAPLVAVLTSAPGAPGRGVVTVSYDPASGRLTSAPTGLDLTGHSAELWVIPAGQSPRSLGVIAAGAPGWTRAPGTAAPALAPGATLAISVEPIGGSPTGQPTGPVILTGKIAAA